MKRILQYIVATILALAILALIIINILTSSILSKEYVLGKLQEQNYYEKTYNEAYINKEVEVLFEEEKEGMYKGHTENYILVYYKINTTPF